MPLKFVTNQVSTTAEDGTATIGATTTTVTEIPTENKFIPEAITDYDGEGSPSGFSLSFTDGTTYDLDEILFNIRRDNPDSPLLMEVVTESSQAEMLIQLATQEILSEYFNQDFLTNNPGVIPNINLIPSFVALLEQRYQQKLLSIDQIEEDNLEEGSLAINATQPKIKVKKEDMIKYLLDGKTTKRSTPIVNLNRPLALWTELTTDLNVPNDFQYFDNLNNVIEDLQAELDANDGGDFEIEDLDGGQFDSEYDLIEDGGGF
jgi:hypothetical protein